jgi:hypothetical protein
MSDGVDMSMVKKFLEEDWTEGWALSYYKNMNGYSKLGLMVYNTKYDFHGKSVSEREQTAEHLRAMVKDFISKKYPINERPFDTVITPPGNLEKPFDLTKYIAARLTSGGIRDISTYVAKTRPIPVMKNLPARERRQAIKDAFELIGLPEGWRPKGVLIFDDILDTGATAGELCNLLEKSFPGVPRYYLSITYLGDGK